MQDVKTLDCSRIAQDLQIKRVQVEAVVQLLDEGNTVPFVARYRKERTGGLEEDKIRQIQFRVNAQRQFGERKKTILKSIENQGKLTGDLREQILNADTPKRLEDVFLPFKPKKRTDATAAREKGLEPLALAVWNRDPAAANLEEVVASVVDPERGLSTPEEILGGVRQILAEMVNETADVRGAARFVMWETGTLQGSKGDKPPKGTGPKEKTDFTEPVRKVPPHRILAINRAEREGALKIQMAWDGDKLFDRVLLALAETCRRQAETGQLPQPTMPPAEYTPEYVTPPLAETPVSMPPVEGAPESPTGEPPAEANGPTGDETQPFTAGTGPQDAAAAPESTTAAKGGEPGQPAEPQAKQPPEAGQPPEAAGQPEPVPQWTGETTAAGQPPAEAAPAAAAGGETAPEAPPAPESEAPAASATETPPEAQAAAGQSPEGGEPSAESQPQDPAPAAHTPAGTPWTMTFPITNEGEQLHPESEYRTPHAAFIKGVVKEAVDRLLVPSLEKEIRRELLDEAEAHAVHVFAENLRALLLQRPVHGRRVLAIDPAFRTGCKLAALDEHGHFLEAAVIYPYSKKKDKKGKGKKGGKEGKPEAAKTGTPAAAPDPGPAVTGQTPPAGETPPAPQGETPPEGLPHHTPPEAFTPSSGTLGSPEASAEANAESGPEGHPVPTGPEAELTGPADPQPEQPTQGQPEQPAVADPAGPVATEAPAAPAPEESAPEAGAGESPPAGPGGEPTADQPAAEAGEPGAQPAQTPEADRPVKPPEEDPRSRAKRTLAELVRKHNLSLIAIGNGTACRETETFVAETIAEQLPDVAYVIVNEAGASVYSASSIGREEFPDLESGLRGTISIGRRLQDPLAELVKIDPPHIGVGLYQHDVSAKNLRESLEGVVESCVNRVGVDVNSASAPLLRHVSGLNQLTARDIVEHREKHGPFRSRQQLRDVPGLNEDRFLQAAGFLKVHGGDSPLDQTWVHPENYDLATRVLETLGYAADVLRDEARRGELRGKLQALAPKELAEQLGAPEPLVHDIIEALLQPGDPRENEPLPIFRKGILKLEDLQPGMELQGTILNVVDFGAFVDIGLKDSGLVHISQMANRFVKNPYDVVAVGNVVTVWVLEVSKERGRVSLTMIKPGTERKAERRPPERTRDRPPPRDRRAPAPQGERPPRPAGRPPGPPRGDRPPRPGGRPPGGPREGAPSGQRGDRPPPRQQQPLPPRKPRKEPPKPKLTREEIEGKKPLHTFAELSALFEARQEDDTKPRPKEERRGRSEGRRGKPESLAGEQSVPEAGVSAPESSPGGEEQRRDEPGVQMEGLAQPPAEGTPAEVTPAGPESAGFAQPPAEAPPEQHQADADVSGPGVEAVQPAPDSPPAAPEGHGQPGESAPAAGGEAHGEQAVGGPVTDGGPHNHVNGGNNPADAEGRQDDVHAGYPHQ